MLLDCQAPGQGACRFFLGRYLNGNGNESRFQLIMKPVLTVPSFLLPCSLLCAHLSRHLVGWTSQTVDCISITLCAYSPSLSNNSKHR